MKKTARLLQNKGFTLIEFVVVAAILALLLGLTTPYLFGTKEKRSLELERDKIVNVLKIAQQNAISARGGYDYSVEFDPNQNRYTRQPEGISTPLPATITIDSASPATIKFLRLTGKPETSLRLILVSKRFESQIEVNEQGIISSTPPEKR